MPCVALRNSDRDVVVAVAVQVAACAHAEARERGRAGALDPPRRAALRSGRRAVEEHRLAFAAERVAVERCAGDEVLVAVAVHVAGVCDGVAEVLRIVPFDRPVGEGREVRVRAGGLERVRAAVVHVRHAVVVGVGAALVAAHDEVVEPVAVHVGGRNGRPEIVVRHVPLRRIELGIAGRPRAPRQSPRLAGAGSGGAGPALGVSVGVEEVAHRADRGSRDLVRIRAHDAVVDVRRRCRRASPRR